MTTSIKVAPVRTEAQYEKTKSRIAGLMPRTDQASLDELEILSTLAEQYERGRVSIDAPSPIAAIRFRMNQAGLRARDLEPFIGGRSRVSEVLAGKRPLSLDMIRALNKHLGIPAQALIGPEYTEAPAETREPSAAALQKLRDSAFLRANETFSSLLDRAFGTNQAAALWRKSRTERTSAKTDHAALVGWLAAVRILADTQKVTKGRRPSAEALGRRIAKLSLQPDGPQRAEAELSRLGIILIACEHLPGTYLDGAAFCRGDGTPVIALTLRHDRIDNFWFTLLHELCHVLKHLSKGTTLIFDDLELKGSDQIEAEADLFAQSSLIPLAIWSAEASPDLDGEDIDRIAALAGVHPAIVAGRWQREHGDYRRFARMLGRGEVREQFWPANVPASP